MTSSGCSPRIDKRREMMMQGRYVRDTSFRACLGTKDAPVVICRGNHDFVGLSQWVGGEVYEIGKTPKTFEVKGLKISGYRGVGPINGAWCDEIPSADERDLAEKLDLDIDILVTHSPPYGIRDNVGKICLGLDGLRGYIVKRMYAEHPKSLTHFFGHIHEAWGYEGKGAPPSPKFHFSNAATGYICYAWKNGEPVMTTASKGAK